MAGKWLDLFGTLKSKLNLGLSGVTLKDASGNLLVRNNADSADAQITASQLNNSGNFIVLDSDATETLTLAKNGSQSSAYTLTFPDTAGSPGQVFSTDGSGNLSWVSAGGSTDQYVAVDTTTLAFGDGATVAMFTLPANAIVKAVETVVDTAFDGTPSMSVGVSGTTSKYMASTQVDLSAAAKTSFEVSPNEQAVGTTEDLIISYTSGSATQGAARVLVSYVIPA